MVNFEYSGKAGISYIIFTEKGPDEAQDGRGEALLANQQHPASQQPVATLRGDPVSQGTESPAHERTGLGENDQRGTHARNGGCYTESNTSGDSKEEGPESDRYMEGSKEDTQRPNKDYLLPSGASNAFSLP